MTRIRQLADRERQAFYWGKRAFPMIYMGDDGKIPDVVLLMHAGIIAEELKQPIDSPAQIRNLHTVYIWREDLSVVGVDQKGQTRPS